MKKKHVVSTCHKFEMPTSDFTITKTLQPNTKSHNLIHPKRKHLFFTSWNLNFLPKPLSWKIERAPEPPKAVATADLHRCSATSVRNPMFGDHYKVVHPKWGDHWPKMGFNSTKKRKSNFKGWKNMPGLLLAPCNPSFWLSQHCLYSNEMAGRGGLLTICYGHDTLWWKGLSSHFKMVKYNYSNSEVALQIYIVEPVKLHRTEDLWSIFLDLLFSHLEKNMKNITNINHPSKMIYVKTVGKS